MLHQGMQDAPPVPSPLLTLLECLFEEKKNISAKNISIFLDKIYLPAGCGACVNLGNSSIISET